MARKLGNPNEDDADIDTAREIIRRHGGDLHAAEAAVCLILSHPEATPGARRAAVTVLRIIRDKIASN